MAELLLHSLAEFTSLILPLLDVLGVRDTVEVGVETGALTRALVERARAVGGIHVGIEPKPRPEAAALFDDISGVLCEGRSLDVLPDLPPMDSYLLDGDHNHYTVLAELKAIAATAAEAGRPFPLVLVHDIGWPCARRDQYYDPASIPPAHLQPHSWDLGIRPGDPGVWPGGFFGAGHFAFALAEGGRSNGVLTAVEDFLATRPDLAFFRIPAVFGLGVLVDQAQAQAAARILAPFHDNPLLAAMERNRLELYVRVLSPALPPCG